MLSNVSELKDKAAVVGSALLNPEERPKQVAEILVTLGTGKLLSYVVAEAKAELVVEGIAGITTVEGFTAKKAEITEIAQPYVAKAYTPEGRQDLVADCKEIVKPYVEAVKQYTEAKIDMGKEYAAPYIATVKETSAPYITKLEEIRKSERVEAMVSAFQEAREHPAEKVSELRAKAVDLIKYEKVKEYQEYVLSPQFQADTVKLVKVDLPAIAKHGADSVKTKATVLAEELQTTFLEKKAKVTEIVMKGQDYVDVDQAKTKVKEITSSLLKELQAEFTMELDSIKEQGFSMNEAIERLKRVAEVVNKLVLSPLKTEVCALTATTKEPADEVTNGVKNGAANGHVNGTTKNGVAKCEVTTNGTKPAEDETM